MSNRKNAQLIGLPNLIPPPSNSVPVHVIEMDDVPEENEDNDEVVFTIGLVPGAPDDAVLNEEDEENNVVQLEEPQEEEEIDEWNWEKSHGVGKFLHWLKSMIDNVPSHDGKSIGGVKRAIAYFERLKKEIDRAMSQDFKRQIDSAKAEEGRDLILEGLNKLTKRLKKLQEKKEKNADTEHTLIKEADTTTTGDMKIVVPYFISIIARTCINSVVSGGKDMKDIFETLDKEYKLDKREKLQVIDFIRRMGYPLVLDKVRMLDGKLDITDGQGEWIINYQA